MRPINALTGAALTLALLTGATAHATASPAAVTGSVTGSVTAKDKAGDHRGKGMIKNARAAEADLRKVSVKYNADQSITATFTLADLRRKRTGPSPTGVQQVVTRKYSLRVTTMESWGPFTATLGYWDPYEGKPVPASTPNAIGENNILFDCPTGSVKFNEDKNALVMRVPSDCYNADLDPGQELWLSADTEVSVKYYDKQLANGVGGGYVGRDSVDIDTLIAH